MDFSHTYAPIGKLTEFWNCLSPIREFGCSVDHMVVVTAFQNPEHNDVDMYLSSSEW